MLNFRTKYQNLTKRTFLTFMQKVWTFGLHFIYKSQKNVNCDKFDAFQIQEKKMEVLQWRSEYLNAEHILKSDFLC